MTMTMTRTTTTRTTTMTTSTMTMAMTIGDDGNDNDDEADHSAFTCLLPTQSMVWRSVKKVLFKTNILAWYSETTRPGRRSLSGRG